MKKPGPPKPRGLPPGGSPKTALLGDLESIRTLLDGAASADSAAADAMQQSDGDVPLLDDVVDGGLRLEETSLERRASIDDGAPGGLDDELFNALLGDSWKESAGRILEQTRAAIEEGRTSWAPEDTDALNEALRVRIDATLRQWLRSLVLAHIDELRTQLLEVTHATIQDEVDSRLGPPSPAGRKMPRG